LSDQERVQDWTGREGGAEWITGLWREVDFSFSPSSISANTPEDEPPSNAVLRNVYLRAEFDEWQEEAMSKVAVVVALVVW
jgi:hypothetical protein